MVSDSADFDAKKLLILAGEYYAAVRVFEVKPEMSTALECVRTLSELGRVATERLPYEVAYVRKHGADADDIARAVSVEGAWEPFSILTTSGDELTSAEQVEDYLDRLGLLSG